MVVLFALLHLDGNQVTWKNIKDMFWSIVADDEDDETYFSQDQVRRWGDSALKELAEHTQYIDKQATGSLTSGTATVDLSGMYRIWRVECDDEVIRPVTQKELRQNDRDWQQRSGKPYWYYLDELGSSPEYTQIGFYETPNSSYSYRVFGWGEPTDLSDTNEDYELQIPRWAAYGILYGVLAQAYMADTEIMNLETSDFYRGLFEDTKLRLRGRSFSKLNKPQTFGEPAPSGAFSLWNRVPDTVPEP